MARTINEKQRLAIYTINEVFDYMDASPNNGARVRFRGHSMHLRSSRMLSFRRNGIECVGCGKKAAFFAKERYRGDKPHLNLYGFNKQGKDLLFTRDHIKPKSKGGTDHLYNTQTMCSMCNCKKDNVYGLRSKTKYYTNKLKYFLMEIIKELIK